MSVSNVFDSYPFLISETEIVKGITFIEEGFVMRHAESNGKNHILKYRFKVYFKVCIFKVYYVLSILCIKYIMY